MTTNLKSLLDDGIAAGAFPGAACAVGSDAGTWFACAGRHTWEPDSTPVDATTLWDMASVTKVAGTTPAAMVLFDDGFLDLERRVSDVLPEFAGPGREWVKVRDLLLHESGLPDYAGVTHMDAREQVWRHICTVPMKYETGTDTVYSCLGFVALQHVVERIAGVPIDQILRERLFGPLGMVRSLYCPGPDLRSCCAPTEALPEWQRALEDRRGFVRVQDQFVQGDVHDPVACIMGGVSGNAGLFSTPSDLAIYLRMLMNDGAAGSKQIVRAETVRAWKCRNSPRSSRALGWDTKSPEGSSAGSRFALASNGHTGYTGTSVWVDPVNRVFAVLCTNRVHPSCENLKIAEFRPRFHDAVFGMLCASSDAP